jgi:hypothetical protein
MLTRPKKQKSRQRCRKKRRKRKNTPRAKKRRATKIQKPRKLLAGLVTSSWLTSPKPRLNRQQQQLVRPRNLLFSHP